MADPSTYRPAAGTIPTRPGVYRFRDEHGRVIYVGKAKNLRSRLSSYFQDITALHERTRRMATTAASVEWTVVGTEVEALTLEYTWIKEFAPRFNVKFRDDKSYPYLVITMGEKVPRVHITRRPRAKGDRTFGPYPQVGAIRETLDLMLRVFPIRSCTPCLVSPAHPLRASLPAGIHRQVRGPLLRGHLRRRPPGAGRAVRRLHGRQPRDLHPPHRAADARGGRSDGLRDRRGTAR